MIIRPNLPIDLPTTLKRQVSDLEKYDNILVKLLLLIAGCGFGMRLGGASTNVSSLGWNNLMGR